MLRAGILQKYRSFSFLGEGLQSCKTCWGAQSSFGMLSMGQENSCFELPTFLKGLHAFRLKFPLVALMGWFLVGFLFVCVWFGFSLVFWEMVAFFS